MNMKKLLQIVDGTATKTPLNESAPCVGTACEAVAVTQTPPPQPPSMNVNFNAYGVDGIRDLLQLFTVAEEPVQDAELMNDVVVIDGPEEDDIGAIRTLSGAKTTPTTTPVEDRADPAVLDKFQANTRPDIDIKDTDYQLNSLAGGLNGPKKQYTSNRSGDNDMRTNTPEDISRDLYALYEQIKNGVSFRVRSKKKDLGGSHPGTIQEGSVGAPGKRGIS
jgi:hypothetical protein